MKGAHEPEHKDKMCTISMTALLLGLESRCFFSDMEAMASSVSAYLMRRRPHLGASARGSTALAPFISPSKSEEEADARDVSIDTDEADASDVSTDADEAAARDVCIHADEADARDV